MYFSNEYGKILYINQLINYGFRLSSRHDIYGLQCLSKWPVHWCLTLDNIEAKSLAALLDRRGDLLRSVHWFPRCNYLTPYIFPPVCCPFFTPEIVRVKCKSSNTLPRKVYWRQRRQWLNSIYICSNGSKMLSKYLPPNNTVSVFPLLLAAP